MAWTTKVDNVDDVMASHINDLQTAMGDWSTWTPTVTQLGSVAVTVNFADYVIINKLCLLQALLTVTGSGTPATLIAIAGIPAAAAPQRNGTYMICGKFIISDAGVGHYEGGVIAQGGNVLRLIRNASTSYVGIDPNFGLASGDMISISCVYKVA